MGPWQQPTEAGPAPVPNRVRVAAGADRPGRVGPDRDVAFDSGGVTVRASLRAPVDPSGAAPAALIIAGSGPTDRDGNSAVPGYEGLELNAYRWLADQLAGFGVASLRFDKLGSGATGLGPYAEDPAALVAQDFDTVVVDVARDALACLAAAPGVDPGGLLLVGHSEGAMVALAVADDPRAAPAPAGLVLVEPAYGRIGDILVRQLTEQLATAVTAGTVTADDGTALSAWASAGLEDLRTLRPPFPEAGPAPLADPVGAASQWQALVAGTVHGRLRSELGRTEDLVDPVALAARWTAAASVLLTCGTKDLNTPLVPDGPPGSGVAALAAAFTDGVAELVVIPDMVHELRDIGDAEAAALAPSDLPDHPFSARLRDELGRFLARWSNP